MEAINPDSGARPAGPAMLDALGEFPLPALSGHDADLLRIFAVADFDILTLVRNGAVPITEALAWFNTAAVRAHLAVLRQLAAEALTLRAAQAAPVAIAALEQIASTAEAAVERRRASIEIIRAARGISVRPTTGPDDNGAPPPPDSPAPTDGSSSRPYSAERAHGPRNDEPAPAGDPCEPPANPEPPFPTNRFAGAPSLPATPIYTNGFHHHAARAPAAQTEAAAVEPSANAAGGAAFADSAGDPPPEVNPELAAIAGTVARVITLPEDEDAIDDLAEQLAPDATILGRRAPAMLDELLAVYPLIPLAHAAPVIHAQCEVTHESTCFAEVVLLFTHSGGAVSTIHVRLTRSPTALWRIQSIDPPP